MSVWNEAAAFTKAVLGQTVTGKHQTIAGAATHQVFTVAGGEVLVTAMWGVCTVEMAGANTVNVQTDPTDGDTVVVASAVDLGTTNTALGTVIAGTPTSGAVPALVKGSGVPLQFVATTGEVESVITGAGADGAIQWYCTYVPLVDGATVVAAA